MLSSPIDLCLVSSLRTLMRFAPGAYVHGSAEREGYTVARQALVAELATQFAAGKILHWRDFARAVFFLRRHPELRTALIRRMTWFELLNFLRATGPRNQKILHLAFQRWRGEPNPIWTMLKLLGERPASGYTREHYEYLKLHSY